MSDRKFNVLFLCTGNSARSILAETALRLEARIKIFTSLPIEALERSRLQQQLETIGRQPLLEA